MRTKKIIPNFRLWPFSDLLLVLLPLSLLVADQKLLPRPLPFYLPEGVALLYFLLIWRQAGWKAYQRTWQALSPRLRFSLKLLLLGLVFGLFFAPSHLAALGAAKTWFLIPGLLLWAILTAHPPDRSILTGLFLFATAETLLGLADTLFGGVRLHGTLISPNYYAAAVMPILLLGLAIWPEIKNRRLWVLFLLLILVGLLLSKSLGGLLGLVVGMTILLYRRPPARWRVIGLGLIGLLAVVGLFLTQQRLSDLPNSSLASRVQIWHTAAYLTTVYPLTGTGLRGFATHYANTVSKFYPLPLEWAVPEPHNLYLAFWLDLGLFGLIGFLGLLIALFRRPLWVPAQYALLGILVHGLLDTPFFKTELAFLFWLYIALILLQQPHDA